MDDQRTDREGGGGTWLRRVRIAFAIYFGITSVLSVVFWVRSYYWYQAVFVRQGAIVYALGAFDGYMCASVRPAYGKGKAWKVNDWPMDTMLDVVAHQVVPETNIFGFGGEKYHEGVAVLLAPAWFVSIGSGMVSLLLCRAKTVAFTVRNLLIATALVAAILGLVVYPK